MDFRQSLIISLNAVFPLFSFFFLSKDYLESKMKYTLFLVFLALLSIECMPLVSILTQKAHFHIFTILLLLSFCSHLSFHLS